MKKTFLLLTLLISNLAVANSLTFKPSSDNVTVAAVTVNQDGSLSNPSLMQIQKHLTEQEALEKLSQIKLKPVTKNSENISFRIVKEFNL